MVILRDFPTNCIVWVGVICITTGCYLLLQREWSEDLEERHQKCFPSAGVSQLRPFVFSHQEVRGPKTIQMNSAMIQS